MIFAYVFSIALSMAVLLPQINAPVSDSHNVYNHYYLARTYYHKNDQKIIYLFKPNGTQIKYWQCVYNISAKITNNKQNRAKIYGSSSMSSIPSLALSSRRCWCHAVR